MQTKCFKAIVRTEFAQMGLERIDDGTMFFTAIEVNADNSAGDTLQIVIGNAELTALKNLIKQFEAQEEHA